MGGGSSTGFHVRERVMMGRQPNDGSSWPKEPNTEIYLQA